MRPLIATVSLAAALLVAGCSAQPAPSSDSSDSGKTPDTAPVASDSVAPEPADTDEIAESEYGEAVKNSRGNLVKEIGQLAGVTDERDVTIARFAVTDIVAGFECDSGWSDPSEYGQYIGIHLNVETTPEMADSEYYSSLSFSSYDWLAFDADGKRQNDVQGNAWSCLAEDRALPMDIGPGQSVEGWIVLDVAADSGALVMTMFGSSTGWEWAY